MNERNNDICNCNVVHPKEINKAKSTMPTADNILDLADFFKVFSDQTRMKIICALKETELCVCDLATVIETSQSAVSHQLRILRQARLVKFRKQGKVAYYSLDDDHVNSVIKEGLQHISHQ